MNDDTQRPKKKYKPEYERLVRENTSDDTLLNAIINLAPEVRNKIAVQQRRASHREKTKEYLKNIDKYRDVGTAMRDFKESAPLSMRTDPEYVISLLTGKKGHSFVRSLPENVQNDPALMLKAVEGNYRVFSSLPRAMRELPEITITALKEYNAFLIGKEVPNSFIQNYFEFVLGIVRKNPHLIRFIIDRPDLNLSDERIRALFKAATEEATGLPLQPLSEIDKRRFPRYAAAYEKYMGTSPGFGG